MDAFAQKDKETLRMLCSADSASAFDFKEAVAYEDENEVIIDFYADALLLTKACTGKFTLDDTDGYIRLDGTEVTYDSGLKIASYTT